MRIPLTPPDVKNILDELFNNDKDVLMKVMNNAHALDSKGRYLHWEKMRFLEPPEGLSKEQWWAATKIARTQLYKNLPESIEGLKYTTIDKTLADLHWLDKNASGSIIISEPVLNSHMKNTYIISSMIEESIRSSQLEGAATTRRVAKKMIQENRKPIDKSEQMIFNNFKAMQFIREIKEEKLNHEIIKELHRILVEDTLSDHEKIGNYRDESDDVHVVDESGLLLFTPPNASEINQRIDDICKFANEEMDEKNFIHPVMRSIILHFLFSYTHPFIDGNGRTARAIFYWSMLKQGYWLTEFISISKILKEAPAQYGYSFLYTETDENDISYFIDHQLYVIRRAIEEFRKYMKKKKQDSESVDELLKKSDKLKNQLNYRQYSIIRHALKHPGYLYSINEHQQIHGVVYDTARKDLLFLAEHLELFIKVKEGKLFKFLAPIDLRSRIEKY